MKCVMNCLIYVSICLVLHLARCLGKEDTGENSNEPRSSTLYSIEGRVFSQPNSSISSDWFTSTRIIVNYGQYLGFMKRDGSFVINNLPPGSYLVEVTNPDLFYKPTRVDINSKGKIRARKVNYIQSSAVQTIPYPLKFKPQAPFKYFQVRETWRLTDFLFNPVVIMMALPLLLILVLPKMMNDAETQKEMQNMQIPRYDVPELSEMVTQWFGGPPKPVGPSPKSGGSKMIKKKQ